MIYISHDLEVVQAVSDRVAVMYQGSLIEMGCKQQIFQEPRHSYTKYRMSTILETPASLMSSSLAL